MTTSPDLGLPYIASAQAQPEVTHNTALNLLALLSNGVLDVGTNTPPGSPTEGDAYVIGASPTGAWAGRANCITGRFGGAWVFVPGNNSSGTAITMGARHEGLSVWNRTTNSFYIWSGSAWAVLAGAPSIQEEGSTVVTAPSLINFVGAGVTATNVGGVATVTVPGGSQSGLASSIVSGDFYPMFDNSAAISSSALNSTSRTEFMLAFVDSAITFTDVALRVVSATASQTIDVGIYSYLGAGKPGTCLAKGQISTTATGAILGTVGTPVALAAGFYYIVMHTTSTSPTVATHGGINSRLVTAMYTDGFAYLGSVSSKYSTAICLDSTLPGGAYSYGMNLTGFTISSTSMFSGNSVTYMVGLKKQ